MVAFGTFDFDELDVAEYASPPSKVPSSEKSGGAETEVTGTAIAGIRDDDQAHLRLRGKKPMSRARAWFEIRRFFEAEPQQYYGSKNSDEWKTYYAKELILKATCERLQQDGYVVIDAKLAPDYFKRLVGQLRLDAPEQAAALEAHAKGNMSMLQDEDGRHSRKVQEAALLPIASSSETLMESPQDQALSESCLLSLAIDLKAQSELRPHSKQQFLKFFKTYIHEVAANSMAVDRAAVREADKISVQFCFGNMPAPKAALSAPPRQLAVEGLTL